uniref:B30.2/SPRY domain-containing protein n=1 Tax=Gouania willdenowi TaxID=441366 RepID=A0A8C5DFW3_GOUWI
MQTNSTFLIQIILICRNPASLKVSWYVTTKSMILNVSESVDQFLNLCFTVDVKLDPTTAHRHLKVSKDCKTVKYGRKNQKVEKSPQRFDKFGSVLGDKGIKSGKSYLEVEVSNKTGWELGVARVDANRQGNLNLNPESGYWVVAHYDDKKFSALKAPPLRLLLSEKPEKVGMFVDYEEGLVSFYNVGAASHIYSFTEGSFSGEILPYFSLRLQVFKALIK